jgi:hypothetical protein
MSQRNRIVLATATLLAVLFLASPSPSHAAARPWNLPVVDAWERAWTWLLHILPGGAPQKPGVQEKEGIGINPDGGKTSGTTTTSTGTQAGEGSSIASNGVK